MAVLGPRVPRHYGIRPVSHFYDVFDDFFDRPFGELAQRFPVSASFKMDVEDTPEAYVISADMPGVSKDEIDVELNEGQLSISVKKEYDSDKAEDGAEKAERNYIHRERMSYSASRGVYLKDAVAEGVSANLKDGVLVVSVPKKTEEAHGTKISID